MKTFMLDLGKPPQVKTQGQTAAFNKGLIRNVLPDNLWPLGYEMHSLGMVDILDDLDNISWVSENKTNMELNMRLEHEISGN
jgi:hypothetical protein